MSEDGATAALTNKLHLPTTEFPASPEFPSLSEVSVNWQVGLAHRRPDSPITYYNRRRRFAYYHAVLHM